VSNTQNDIPICSIVLPVFNEEEGIETFHLNLISEISKIKEYYFEVLYVDDGSTDGSFESLKRLKSTGSNSQIRLVKFSRNFGHQSALLAGMQLSTGALVITMDSDGQDPPNIIPAMLEATKFGYEIVYAQRKSRVGDSRLKRLTAFIYYRVLNMLAETKIPVDTGDFRLISRRALGAVLDSVDSSLYLRGLVSWVGFSSTTVVFDRERRISGVTKYPFIKMLTLAVNGVTSFSTKPLRLGLHTSGFIALLSMIASAYVIFMKLFSPTSSLPGYTTIVVLFLWSLSIQLFCIGLIGEYLSKNIEETRERPHYIIESQD